MIYGERISNYENGRPAYPISLLEYISEKVADGIPIADIGAGTGKLSQQLLICGKEVIAVEPDEMLCGYLQKKLSQYKHFSVIQGSAEHTTLLDNSVGCVCAAQALHWFNAEKFGQELNRILKKNGRVFIIHNIPPKIIQEIQIPIPGSEVRELDISKSLQDRAESRRAFLGEGVEYELFDNDVVYNEEKFLDYFLSFSTVPRCYLEDRNNIYCSMVRKAFRSISTLGSVMLPFKTEVYTSIYKQ